MVDFFVWHGAKTSDTAAAAFRSALDGAPPRGVCYNPARPERRQRNRAVRTRAEFTPIYEQSAAVVCLATLGLEDRDELRVLLCDGPALIAWVGGWRSDDFGRREAALLCALAPALAKRLRLERDLQSSSLPLAALDAALGALGAAAFITRRDGSVVRANEPGRALVAHGYEAVRGRLRDAVAHPQEAGGGHQVTRIRAKGLGEHFLVVCTAATPDAARRTAAAAKNWGLTPREAEVLVYVVDGADNKTVASKLGVSVRTVELHVSHLLRKAGASRRSEAVARFWADARA